MEISPKEYIEALEANREGYRRQWAALKVDTDIIRDDPVTQEGVKAGTLTRLGAEMQTLEWRITEIERRLEASAAAAMNGTEPAKV